MHVQFLLGAYYRSPSLNDKIKEKRRFFPLYPSNKTYRKNSQVRSRDIWNNGFSILDTKNVQKFIK